MGILKGKTAIVTGGGTGIGLAIARRFCEEGAVVVICGRREDRLQAAAAGMTDGLGRVCAVRADVTVEEDIRRLIATAEEKTGRLDIVVNNAGVMRFGKLDEVDPAQWELVQVGFIFHYSWGYDQTNNDFYQVIAKKGQFVTIREIGQESVSKGAGYSSMSDFRRPLKDSFIEKAAPMIKKIQFSSGKPFLKMNSYGWCDLWDGREAYNSWYA